jgi:hypothetical protein
MKHLPHLKHIRQLELVGARGMNIEKVELINHQDGWLCPEEQEYDWYFYLIDGKFVLCHPYSSQVTKIQDEVYATQYIHEPEHDSLLTRLRCKARISSQLDDSSKGNQHLFVKHLHSAVIIKLDFQYESGQASETLPQEVMVTSEWLHEGKLYWLTNMLYNIYPSKSTFNALKINEQTPAGNWHVKLYVRDECFASLSFRIEDNSFSIV